MQTPGDPGAAPAETCARCGAELAEEGTPAGRPAPAPEPVAPGTHCEWCGAEYDGPPDEG
jgi:hypothetical protein